MKFVLNNRDDLAMEVDNLGRNLSFDTSLGAVYDIYISTENINNSFTMSNLVNFIGQPITSYALYNQREEDNELFKVMGEDGVEINILNFSENFTPETYNGSASFQVLRG